MAAILVQYVIVISLGTLVYGGLIESTPASNISVPVWKYYEFIAGTLSNIDPKMVPVDDLSKALDLTIQFGLLSLTHFDEISGQINMVASLNISWEGSNLPTWESSLFGGKDSFAVPTESVWHPKLLLLNPAKTVGDLTKMSDKLRILSTGAAEWDVIAIIEASCSVDVALFPFDIQTCTVNIAPWGYDTTEIHMRGLRVVQSLGSLSNIQNTEWELLNINVIGNNNDRIPYLEVSLSVKRKYEYFLVNVLLAPILLSILSPCVFLLPASSGERMSFSITCFLSFSVFLNLISDNMPKSSVPIANLSYFMMYMLIHSCSVLFSTIVTLRIYHTDVLKPIPRWVRVFVKIVRFHYCIKQCNGKPGVTPMQMRDQDIRNDSIEMKEIKLKSMRGEIECTKRDAITWYLVSETMDRVFFAAYIGWMLFTIITFFTAVNVI